MQKDGDQSLKGTKLGMDKLYKHVLKTDLPSKYYPCSESELLQPHRCSQGPRWCAGNESSSYSPFTYILPVQAPVPLSKPATEVMVHPEDSSHEVHIPHQFFGETCHYSGPGKEAGFCRILICWAGEALHRSKGWRRFLEEVEGQGCE